MTAATPAVILEAAHDYIAGYGIDFPVPAARVVPESVANAEGFRAKADPGVIVFSPGEYAGVAALARVATQPTVRLRARAWRSCGLVCEEAAKIVLHESAHEAQWAHGAVTTNTALVEGVAEAVALDLYPGFARHGTIRTGRRAEKGNPERLETFRLTSPSHDLLETAATVYGGTVSEWSDPASEDKFELITETDSLDVAIPPTQPAYTQAWELWGGAGRLRKCDGTTCEVTDAATGEVVEKSCLCDPDQPECSPVTRVRFMLPRVKGLGTWLYVSHGMNVALELPGTLDVLAGLSDSGRPVLAKLRLVQKVTKRPGQPTKRYSVVALDLDVTLAELMSGTAPERQTLSAPVAQDLPAVSNGGASSEPDPPGLITEAQRRRLFAMAKKAGVDTPRLKEMLVDVTGQDSTKGITILDYEAVVTVVEAAGLSEQDGDPMMFPPASRGTDADA